MVVLVVAHNILQILGFSAVRNAVLGRIGQEQVSCIAVRIVVVQARTQSLELRELLLLTWTFEVQFMRQILENADC